MHVARSSSRRVDVTSFAKAEVVSVDGWREGQASKEFMAETREHWDGWNEGSLSVVGSTSSPEAVVLGAGVVVRSVLSVDGSAIGCLATEHDISAGSAASVTAKEAKGVGLVLIPLDQCLNSAA